MTTDPERFYCKRKLADEEAVRGYEAERKSVLLALKQFTVKRYVAYQSPKQYGQPEDQEVTVINKTTVPDFFAQIAGNGWMSFRIVWINNIPPIILEFARIYIKYAKYQRIKLL